MAPGKSPQSESVHVMSGVPVSYPSTTSGSNGIDAMSSCIASYPTAFAMTLPSYLHLSDASAALMHARIAATCSADPVPSPFFHAPQSAARIAFRTLYHCLLHITTPPGTPPSPPR